MSATVTKGPPDLAQHSPHLLCVHACVRAYTHTVKTVGRVTKMSLVQIPKSDILPLSKAIKPQQQLFPERWWRWIRHPPTPLWFRGVGFNAQDTFQSNAFSSATDLVYLPLSHTHIARSLPYELTCAHTLGMAEHLACPLEQIYLESTVIIQWPHHLDISLIITHHNQGVIWGMTEANDLLWFTTRINKKGARRGWMKLDRSLVTIQNQTQSLC